MPALLHSYSERIFAAGLSSSFVALSGAIHCEPLLITNHAPTAQAYCDHILDGKQKAPAFHLLRFPSIWNYFPSMCPFRFVFFCWRFGFFLAERFCASSYQNWSGLDNWPLRCLSKFNCTPIVCYLSIFFLDSVSFPIILILLFILLLCCFYVVQRQVSFLIFVKYSDSQ